MFYNRASNCCLSMFAELMRVLWRFFDSWFLLVNLLIMFVCVVISLFTKDPASPSIYPWSTSPQHEQVRRCDLCSEVK